MLQSSKYPMGKKKIKSSGSRKRPDVFCWQVAWGTASKMRIPSSKSSSISKTMYIQSSWNFPSSTNITESLACYLQACLQSSHTHRSLSTPTNFYAREIWASILCQFARPSFQFCSYLNKVEVQTALVLFTYSSAPAEQREDIRD